MTKYLRRHPQFSQIKETLAKAIQRVSVVRRNVKCVEFDQVVDIVLEEYSKNTKDPILEFFQTADVSYSISNTIS